MAFRTSRVSLLASNFAVFLTFILSATASSDVKPVPPIQKIEVQDPISSALVNGCPQPCSVLGSNPANWTQLHSQDELLACDQPLLFVFNVQNVPNEYTTIQACTQSSSEGMLTRKDAINHEAPQVARRSVTVSNNCGAGDGSVAKTLLFGPGGVVESGNDVVAAAELLTQYMENDATCGTTLILSKSGSAVVGIYKGADVQNDGVSNIIQQSSNYLGQGTQIVQICDSNDVRAETVGIFAANAANGMSDVQNALKTWANGKCVQAEGTQETINLDVLTVGSVQSRSVELRSRFTGMENLLSPRANCKTIAVQSGDSCASLAKRCKITAANFSKYNPKANLCSTLMPKQLVCCTAGTLPDNKPKPLADGTCFTYAIKAGDSCYSIAQSYNINQNSIPGLNKNTFGWAGCNRLQIGQRICLSAGTSPLPAPVSGAVCGPQVPGTKKPAGAKTGWDLVGLNPCPLNACCSGFGFCGTTGDFCTNTTAKGGAPGTYKANTAGCISNCGTTIVGNSKPPAKFLSVGYFQGYNLGRPCLNMDVGNLTSVKTSYTHVHFAFAGLTTTFGVSLDSTVSQQFTKFVALKGPWKKIISFGGWAGSTDAATFQRYRDAITPANRQTFATNVINFLNKYKLDGVDFDWEYPGAEDATGANTDATNYVQFLTLMRSKLGTSGKTMSVALPAAYWYLKPFPVAKMAPLVDYLVYMTYDLHGQWDYGNKYADSGCPTGNCLRSHVNKTETLNSLVMITKAGVPPSKIVVGVSSYGRSFKMQNPSCTGPNCLFTGSFSVSQAEPGVCTQDAGYLANAEITNIITNANAKKPGVTAKSWYDAASDSNIMTWGTQGEGNANWVAYMSDSTKAARKAWIQKLNFAGSIDWAIDLQTWFSPQPSL